MSHVGHIGTMGVLNHSSTIMFPSQIGLLKLFSTEKEPECVWGGSVSLPRYVYATQCCPSH